METFKLIIPKTGIVTLIWKNIKLIFEKRNLSSIEFALPDLRCIALRMPQDPTEKS